MKSDVTMYTLAAALNVSIATVSRAFTPNSKLSKSKRELVLKTAQEMGYTPNNMASRLSQSTIHIGVLIYGYMSVYDNEIIAGIESAYREMHGFKVVCDIRRLYDADATMEDALAVLDDFKQKQYRGVMISKLPGDVVTEKIEELYDAGIETVIFDADIPQSKRLFVSMNNIDVATNMVAQMFSMILPEEQRKIVLFNCRDQEELTSLFIRHAQENNIEVAAIERLRLRNSEAVLQENMERIGKVLTEHDDIRGAYVSCANCIPVCNYIVSHHLEKKIRLITSDFFAEMRPYFLNGVIDASIYQNPFSQGSEAFKSLYYYLAEKKKPVEQLLVHPQIIMRSNMNLF